jgi:hypothetical protein
VRIQTPLPFTAVLLALAAPAAATTYVDVSERTLTRSADAVVVGTIRRIESVATPNGGISTLVTVAVESEHKSRVGREITLKQPGGRVGRRLQWIAGSPRFTVGERQLLFLTAHRDGTARTTAFGLGQFTVTTHARTGELMAERKLDGVMLGRRPLRRTRLARILQTVERAVRLHGQQAVAPLVTAPVELTTPGLERQAIERFTVMDGPPGRWFEPDEGAPVVYSVDPAGDSGLGVTASFAAIDGALAAWTNVSGARIVLQRGGTAPVEPLNCNGVTQIVFNDPFDEMPTPIACSGVLALGGYCAGNEQADVNGTTFYRISEGNITFNKGFAKCSFWNETNLAEVATHEVGHTIGIGHSSEEDNATPALKDATMYYRAHFDGRGATVHADDIDAVRFVYPGPGGPEGDDSDGDGMLDTSDNCSAIPNSAQTDSDGDGLGDLCDPCPLAASGDDASACLPVAVSSITALRKPSGIGRLVWKGTIDLPDGTSVDNARALLVGARGILADSAMATSVTRLAALRAQIRYRSSHGTITLKKRGAGVYAVRVTMKGVTLGTGTLPLVSANLMVGDSSFTDSLSCQRPKKRKIACRG